jgi:hypothetical protein
MWFLLVLALSDNTKLLAVTFEWTYMWLDAEHTNVAMLSFTTY